LRRTTKILEQPSRNQRSDPEKSKPQLFFVLDRGFYCAANVGQMATAANVPVTASPWLMF